MSNPVSRQHTGRPVLPPVEGDAFPNLVLIIGTVGLALFWIPFIGPVLGLVGIFLGVVAVRTRTGLGRTITGIAFSSIAAFTGSLLVALWIVVPLLVVGASYGFEGQDFEGDTEYASSSLEEEMLRGGSEINTACYHFTGPGLFTNVTTSRDRRRCATTLELRGRTDSDGEFKPSPHGPVVGTVTVRPISASVENKLAPDGTLEAMVTGLGRSYIPRIGDVVSLRREALLGSSKANLSTLVPASSDMRSEVVICAYSAYRYTEGGTETHFFVVTVSTPLDNIDDITDVVSESWDWK